MLALIMKTVFVTNLKFLYYFALQVTFDRFKICDLFIPAPRLFVKFVSSILH